MDFWRTKWMEKGLSPFAKNHPPYAFLYGNKYGYIIALLITVIISTLGDRSRRGEEERVVYFLSLLFSCDR